MPKAHVSSGRTTSQNGKNSKERVRGFGSSLRAKRFLSFILMNLHAILSLTRPWPAPLSTLAEYVCCMPASLTVVAVDLFVRRADWGAFVCDGAQSVVRVASTWSLPFASSGRIRCSCHSLTCLQTTFPPHHPLLFHTQSHRSAATPPTDSFALRSLALHRSPSPAHVWVSHTSNIQQQCAVRTVHADNREGREAKCNECGWIADHCIGSLFCCC